jgi:hypothetical protein
MFQYVKPQAPHTRHNTSPKYKEHKQGENSHMPTSQENMYYINTRPGRNPEKCIGRRDTTIHLENKEILLYTFNFMFNDITF